MTNKNKWLSALKISKQLSAFKDRSWRSLCNYFNVKGALMQISKSANIFVFIWKSYAEDFSLNHIKILQRKRLYKT